MADKQAQAPSLSIRFEKPLKIMKHQVSAADYQRCVSEAACRALDRGVIVAADRPAVQVSWHDAHAYAGWLSRKTGEHYLLPTDEEWAFAAGNKFRDDGLPVDDSDPSKRWIARHDRESSREFAADSAPRPFGSFGANENCSIPPAMSGNGPARVSYAPRLMMPVRRFQKIRIAASASPRANTDPMSRISSATPALAAAPLACRRAISASGWFASRSHG
jgi:hypothetical protein